MIMVVVVVPITMATCPRVFEVTTAAFGLPAVFPVLAFRIVQFVFRIADPLLAFSVIIAIQRPCGYGSAQE